MTIAVRAWVKGLRAGVSHNVPARADAVFEVLTGVLVDRPERVRGFSLDILGAMQPGRWCVTIGNAPRGALEWVRLDAERKSPPPPFEEAGREGDLGLEPTPEEDPGAGREHEGYCHLGVEEEPPR